MTLLNPEAHTVESRLANADVYAGQLQICAAEPGHPANSSDRRYALRHMARHLIESDRLRRYAEEH